MVMTTSAPAQATSIDVATTPPADAMRSVAALSMSKPVTE
jgi:hypothetical protein